MATPPEAVRPAATGTPASCTAATPAAATEPAFSRPTPASATSLASTVSRSRATMALFRTPSARTATPALAEQDGGNGSQEPESCLRSSQIDNRSEEKWTLYFTCKGVPAGQEFIQYETDRSDLTFGNLLIMKSHMGYGVRDYLYYKNKKAVATLKEIDYDVDANSMVVINADEGEIRLVGIK
ncbi:hypothetical protein PAHAL_6G139700 [Panicum hallii]|uniref:Uncharacterized protein n=1 Tax=Panicum hallii TaxID=206008 RepID=A0A2S3I1X0_9POAL|nr:uncharacterized protein LOC112896442 [Panicum hallii]PAN34883.1 hypothetical protein PAHAL_6G139700 [Panicum hallii]PVH36676.1 hypothetical protein PAHAL_6G139700 [Panicum hallii]